MLKYHAVRQFNLWKFIAMPNLEELQNRLSTFKDQYKALEIQMTTTSDSIENVKLQRRLQSLNEYIQQISVEIEIVTRMQLRSDKNLDQEDSRLTNKLEVLRELNLGRIVAEQDDLLDTCFIPNNALREVVSERADLVLGTKGSGKSAIWVELSKTTKNT